MATVTWVDCPKCSEKLTCKYYVQMQEIADKQKEQVCIMGCK